MTTPDPQHVFISYSTKDVHFVERLRAMLRDAHIPYWIDKEGLQPGTPSWEKALRAAIKQAFAVILVASPNSYDSGYVQDEITIAQISNRVIYPVWAHGSHFIESVPMGMGKTQYIDLRGDWFEPNFPQLIKALGGALPDLAYTPPPVKPPAPGVVRRSPYKGLSAFQEADAGDFFGRAAAISELIAKTGERVKAERGRLLAVIGASGSGKSSVVMAGLLPRLKKGDALAGSESWLYAPPITPGNTPIRALTRGLSRALPEKSFGAIEDDLWRPNGLGLANLAYTVDQRMILFIDQFEEVFMPSVSPDERDQMINLLVQAANEPRGSLTVLLTLRADYYDRPMNDRELGELISRNQYSLLPMTLTELREAVENPALLPDTGLAFEPGLVGEIVFDLREAKDKMALAGALPLLQFTLQQLYDKRDTSQPVHVLTMSAYADLGGVSGAISQHAESVFAGLDEEAQGRLGRVFFRLIHVDERGEPTRQRAQLSDFENDESAMRLIDAFVGSRLLLANRTEEAATLEVAHEALLRNWEQLVKWIAEAAESKRLLQKLEMDADFWVKRGKPRDQYRYTHEQEVEIEAIREVWGITFSPQVQEFLQPQIDRWISDLVVNDRLKQQTAEQGLQKVGSSAVPMLIWALSSHLSAEVRQMVASILGGLKDSRAVAPLIAALVDPNEYVKRNAAEALGRLGDKRAVDSLVIALADPNEYVRRNAAEALGRLGDKRAVDSLVIALADPNEYVRRNAVEALGRLGDKCAVTPLIAALTDSDWRLRINTAEALGSIGDLDAIKPLLKLLTDEYILVREAAKEAIARLLGETPNDSLVSLVIALADSDDYVRSSAARALGDLGDLRAFDYLITALTDPIGDVRSNAAQAFGRLGDLRAVDLLIITLIDPDSEVRSSAVSALGQLGDLRAVAPLITILADPDIDVSSGVARVLGQLGDLRAVPPLVDALANNRSGDIVLLALKKFGSQAIPMLTDTFSLHQSPLVRSKLIQLFREFRVIEPLITALNDSDSHVRVAAIEALGRLGDLRAVDPLITILTDPNERVRESTVRSLGQLGDPRAVDPLTVTIADTSINVATHAAQVLGQLGGIAHLVAALTRSNIFVKRLAAQVLGQLGDPRAFDPLVAALSDPEPSVKRSAAEALGQLGDPRAVDPLIAALADNDLANSAAQSLGQLGDPRAVDPLLTAFTSRQLVSENVVRALGQLGDVRAITPLENLLMGLGEHRHNEGLITASRATLKQLRAKSTRPDDEHAPRDEI